MNPNLDRFSDRWEKDTPLECFDCGEPLTETATTLYWDEHPLGDGEPRCLDCKSQLAVFNAPEPEAKRENRVLSCILLGLILPCAVGACLHPQQGGYFILAAIGLGNLGLMARITGH